MKNQATIPRKANSAKQSYNSQKSSIFNGNIDPS